MDIPQRIKIELPYDPAIPFLYIFKIIKGIVSKRYLHTYILSDVTHNRQKVRATEILGKNTPSTLLYSSAGKRLCNLHQGDLPRCARLVCFPCLTTPWNQEPFSVLKSHIIFGSISLATKLEVLETRDHVYSPLNICCLMQCLAHGQWLVFVD